MTRRGNKETKHGKETKKRDEKRGLTRKGNKESGQGEDTRKGNKEKRQGKEIMETRTVNK